MSSAQKRMRRISDMVSSGLFSGTSSANRCRKPAASSTLSWLRPVRVLPSLSTLLCHSGCNAVTSFRKAWLVAGDCASATPFNAGDCQFSSATAAGSSPSNSASTTGPSRSSSARACNRTLRCHSPLAEYPPKGRPISKGTHKALGG